MSDNVLGRYGQGRGPAANVLAPREGWERLDVLPFVRQHAYNGEDIEAGPWQWGVPQMGADVLNAIGAVGGSPVVGRPFAPSARPEMTQEMIGHAGAVVGPQAGVGIARNVLGGGSRSELGIFGGRMAKTADHAALARAEKMAADGVPREQIWNDTGWFQGADGKWRFEIDDSGARLTDWDKQLHGASNIAWPAEARVKSGVTSTPTAMSVGDFISHPSLERAYWPTRDSSPSVFYDRLEGAQARYHPQHDTLEMDIASVGLQDGGRSMALHELQHSVQNREGFAHGGNRRMFSPEEIAAERARMNRASDDGWSSVGPAGDFPDDLIARNLYQRLAGETEARAVQTRRDMTPDQRRQRPPWLDYDVPEADQIVRFR